ncbi:MAG TPA: reverse transcriptase family protein [Saprospiraceae bacterium]|nr:reverse transcriptase family protein [Saprospiraceae bacterium]HMP26218.1 reverse transcriptase family protein [Saprospiraceae bacterium]
MAKKIKLSFVKKAAAQFCKLRRVEDLASLLSVEAYHLQMLALKPHYHIFTVPKKSGAKRWIEDPDDRLQDVQSQIAFRLALVYHLCRSAAAYGFMLGVKSDTQPRNIVTNARRHLGQPWLFNADLQDFFHQVKTERVFRIFSAPPFGFEQDLADLLARLVTHQGRLPMGAPTSPVLSNFATLTMDERLLQVSEWANWTYTRYADDLCFSSQQAFSDKDLAKIREIVEGEGYTFNEQKLQLLGPTEQKVVTGIQLGTTDIQVPDGFVEDLRLDLDRLRHVIEVANAMGQQEKWIDRFRQQVEGRVNFVEFVLGENDTLTAEMHHRLDDALDPPDEFGAKSWLDFGYF